MSHISKIELEVRDLVILSQACSRIGLEFVRGQKTFKWFGQNGHCDHAIRVSAASYEIGVAKTEGRFELLCDYYDANIEKAIGKNLPRKEYAGAPKILSLFTPPGAKRAGLGRRRTRGLMRRR